MPTTKNSVICSKTKCGGVLFDTSPLIAHATGIKHVQCDKCHCKWAISFEEQDDDAQDREGNRHHRRSDLQSV
jgi:hypothetical protein